MNWRRSLSLVSIFSLVVVAGLAGILLFPQPLFSHSYSCQNVTIYSNYPVEKDAWQEAVVLANARIKSSFLYDSTYSFDVFIAEESAFNKLDDLLLGKWSVARAISNNIIIKKAVDEQRLSVANGENSFSLEYVLTHEMTHCLQANYYGIEQFNPFHHPPLWKLEGYPEYIARRASNHSFDLKASIEQFLEHTTENKFPDQIIQIADDESTPYIYFKGLLLTSFLLQEKGLSYTEILSEEITEEAVFEEMLKWYENRK